MVAVLTWQIFFRTLLSVAVLSSFYLEGTQERQIEVEKRLHRKKNASLALFSGQSLLGVDGSRPKNTKSQGTLLHTATGYLSTSRSVFLIFFEARLRLIKLEQPGSFFFNQKKRLSYFFFGPCLVPFFFWYPSLFYFYTLWHIPSLWATPFLGHRFISEVQSLFETSLETENKESRNSTINKSQTTLRKQKGDVRSFEQE